MKTAAHELHGHVLATYSHKREWSDYYGDSGSFSTSKERKITGTFSAENSNQYITDCFFEGCTSSSNGGAVFLSYSSAKTLIEKTSFANCKSSGAGGSFYLIVDECIIYRICSYRCVSTKAVQGQNDYVSVSGDNKRNHYKESSISYAINSLSSSQYIMYHLNGEAFFVTSNSSQNKCYFTSILRFQSSSCSLLFSSFTNNTASHNLGIELGASSELMKCCNAINNLQLQSFSGLLVSYKSIEVRDSCFLGNRIYHTFYIASGICTIISCTIEDSFTTYGTVEITKKASKSFINAIKLIETAYCDAKFDYYGTLTAALDKHRKTRMIKKYRITLMRLLICVFLISLLTTDAPKSERN